MNIDVVEFREDLSKDFARLNYAWIEKFFEVEQHDREILDDPKKWVMDPGGMIFFVVADGVAAGTVALIPSATGVLELTKMAVSPEFQGRGFADELLSRSIEYAKSTGASLVWLESHTKLAPAITLYRKHGFVEVRGDPNSLYKRADIRMELAIDGTDM